jgi:hypothetical protein
MILDKAPRALIGAGFFCLAAALGGGAQAAQVYPGCAQPGPTGKVWWIDSVNGKTPADGGNGSQANPWNSLAGVISGQWATTNFSIPGYTRPLLSNVPYYHITKAGRVDVADQIGNPPVHPGDTLMLMNGNYGDVVIGAFNLPTTNSDWITVAAVSGQTPVFNTLVVSRTNKWVFNGIKVQSLAGPKGSRNNVLVAVTDQGASYPTADIILENMHVSTADNTTAAGWTQADWLARIRDIGIIAKGGDHGADTTCVSVTNSHISKVIFGAELMANNMLFSGNEIDRFGDDGIDYAASNILITKNYIHDDLDLGTGAHMDGMQGYPGAFSNIVIDSNRIIRQTDPKLPFPNYLQGIDAFDGDWTNVTVTNNLIVTSACWGILYASLHNSKIINNTIVADGMMPMPGDCKPIVAVTDKTHQGTSSNDDIIRNNLANGFSIYNVDPNMTMDHNICITIEGKCGILTYVDGKPKWGVYKPGEYGDHNIIERNGAAGMFVNFHPAKFVYGKSAGPAIVAGNSAEAAPVSSDPAKFLYDLRLRPRALAIGAGNSVEAPSVDITGAPRGSRVDIGAYQYSPLK